MRDLYFKLGIERNASVGEVAAALDIQPEMSVYAPILLDEEKRAIYDRTHATLSAIGELRHQLGLNSGNIGFVEKYPDFALRRRVATSTKSAQAGREASGPEGTQEIGEQKNTESKPSARSKWQLPVLLGMIALILLALVLILL